MTLFSEFTFSNCCYLRLIVPVAAILVLLLGTNGVVLGQDYERKWDNFESQQDLGPASTKSKTSMAAFGNDVFPLACGERPSTDQSNYDVLMYDIFLKITKSDPGFIAGRVTCLAKIVEANTETIEIDLAENMTVDSVYSPEGRLDSERDGEVIVVTLDGKHNEGDTISVTTFYRGRPIFCGLQGYDADIDKFRTINHLCISTLSEPSSARTWWPCKDRMDDKADSFKIAVQVHAPLDQNFICVTNGHHDSTTTLGETARTFYYTESHPMSTYLFSLAISDYGYKWEDTWTYKDNDGQKIMPLYYYTFEKNSDLIQTWGAVPDILDLFSDWFGIYPFADEKYGHVNFQAGYAMEHQTISSFPWAESLKHDTIIVAHELAHQWWGNMITCESWHHCWLNEGWARYSEALFRESTGGHRGYHAYMNAIKCTLSVGRVYVDDTTDINAIFDEELVYNKGAWVLHMLRHKLGDSLFKAGIRGYYHSDCQYSSATTEDMRDAFEDSTDIDLHPFFDQWIYGEGYPIYHWSYLPGPANLTSGSTERLIYFRVEQVQTATSQVFEMPVDLKFKYADGESKIVRVEIDSLLNRFAVRVDKECDTVLFDPDKWVLCEERHVDWRGIIIPDDPSVALHNGTLDSLYNDTIYTSSEIGKCKFEIKDVDSFPPGYKLNPDSGIISGTCKETGTWVFTVVATLNDDITLTDTATLSIVVDTVIKSRIESYTLHPNYPNPFNAGTLIKFDLPKQAHVSIDIFNILGQKVRTLVNRHFEGPSSQEIIWNGYNNAGRAVSS
ncbi:MAG: hypothetical protein DRP47_03270, partial [Candidatus Zixiibacteriota bacterium]